MLTKSEIIRRLQEEKPFLVRNFGVVDIGLFGSFAKERQRNDSDIDLIYECRGGKRILEEKRG